MLLSFARIKRLCFLLPDPELTAIILIAAQRRVLHFPHTTGEASQPATGQTQVLYTGTLSPAVTVYR